MEVAFQLDVDQERGVPGTNDIRANTSPDILFVNQVITYCLFDLPVKLEQVHPYRASGLFGNCVQIFFPKSNVNTSFPKYKVTE